MTYRIIGVNHRLDNRKIEFRGGLDFQHAKELASSWNRGENEGWTFWSEPETPTETETIKIKRCVACNGHYDTAGEYCPLCGNALGEA